MQAEFPIKHYIESEEYNSFSESLKYFEFFNQGIAGFCKQVAEKSVAERAVLAIASSVISLVHSTNLLLRNGYLVACKVLLRPIIDRIAILACVTKNKKYLAEWYEGWKTNSGPKDEKGRANTELLWSELNHFNLQQDEPRTLSQVLIDDFKAILNSEIHGSFNSVELNKTGQEDSYASGPNPDSATEFSSIIKLVVLLMSQLQFEVYHAIPKLLNGLPK
jgi:hypothetical protein